MVGCHYFSLAAILLGIESAPLTEDEDEMTRADLDSVFYLFIISSCHVMKEGVSLLFTNSF